ncbi:MAG: PIN domain-containing protein [Ignavibacteriota bacterium]
MKFVLDACALIAYLRKESGGEVVRDLMLESKNECYVHALNLCEIYYDFYRAEGSQIADEVLQIVGELGIHITEDMDEILWKEAGQIKLQLKEFPLPIHLPFHSRFD